MRYATPAVVVLLLICVGAGPATQPTQKITVAKALESVPAKDRGPRTGAWTDLQCQAFGAALSKKYQDANIVLMAGKIESVDLVGRTAVVRSRVTDQSGGGVFCGNTKVLAKLSSDAEAGAATLKVGDPVVFNGHCDRFVFTSKGERRDKGIFASLVINISDASFK